MNEILDKKQQTIRKVRFYYSIIVAVSVLIMIAGYICYLISTMPTRRLMMQLQRAKNAAQIENILQKSTVRLSDDRMAEVYINCAMNAFNEKKYEESICLLRKVIQSNAHPEFKGMSQLELANAYILMGDYQKGINELDLLIASKEIPDEFKIKARNAKSEFRR